MYENFLKSPSAGELSNTKDFHQASECNIDETILSSILNYIGRPISINNGKIEGYNGSSFHGVVCSDVGSYNIGVFTKSIAISKKGCRWVRAEDGLKNGDLVKIAGTGDTAIFAKASPQEINKAVGKALSNSIAGNEGYVIVEIDFNTSFIKDVGANASQSSIENQPNK